MNTSTPTRPRTITLTLWYVLFMGVWNGGRAIAVSQQSSVSLALGIKPDPRLRLAIALVWTICFLGITLALWQKRPFTRRAIPILLLAYALVELSLFARQAKPTPGWQSWLPRTALYAFVILFSHWALNRTAARPYFTHRDDSTN